MHFKVIPCNFGPIMKKLNCVEKITLKDLWELSETIKDYKEKSENNFHKYFCSPMSDISDKFVHECKKSDPIDKEIKDLSSINKKRLKSLLNKMRMAALNYLRYETNGRGRIKLKHIVSAQRVVQVIELEKICKSALAYLEKVLDDNKIEKNIEKEREFVNRSAVSLDTAINDAKGFGKETLLGKNQKEFFKYLLGEFEDKIFYKDSYFYTSIEKIEKVFNDLCPYLENIIKVNSQYKKGLPIPIEQKADKTKFFNLCNDILNIIEDFLKYAKSLDGLEPEYLNRARIAFMNKVKDMVEKTKSYETTEF